MTERYLPKWAAEEMADLKRENDRLKGENVFLKAAYEGTEGSTSFELYRSLSVTPLFAPADTDHVTVRTGGLELYVRPNGARSNGGVGIPGTVEIRNQGVGGLYIIHQSGNTCHVGSTYDRRLGR